MGFLENLFKTILTIILAMFAFIFVYNVLEVKSEQIENLPFCDETLRSDEVFGRLIYVSTLDGTLSALDVTKDGTLMWKVTSQPGPLLSSSIHRLELTDKGQLVRMIPSLSGSLYKFDGENIEPIPITVDQLLSSSMKFSDDLVVSGGKETRSYGISIKTGRIIYECSIHGCQNNTDLNEEMNTDNNQAKNIELDDSILIMRRHTQTVRATEPRSGGERWNYSVGSHELEFLGSADCHNNLPNEIDKYISDIEYKIVVPEGIICAIQKSNPNNIIWKRKFDFPIVNVWRPDGKGSIKEVDVFLSNQFIWNEDLDINLSKDKPQPLPTMYVGMFQKQPYIQESVDLRNYLSDSLSFSNNIFDLQEAKIPWKPVPASIPGNDLISNEEGAKGTSYELAEINSATGLSLLYATEYVNGNGFFVYSDKDFTIGRNQQQIPQISKDYHNDRIEKFIANQPAGVAVIISSIWYWWKELVIIFITFLMLNVFIAYRLNSERILTLTSNLTVKKASSIEITPSTEEMEQIDDSIPEEQKARLSISDARLPYQSRFTTDFDLIQCLGKGGFGVVFESKHKIDDCKYAVKRIILPEKKESRDRVMREVKTLAQCEHKNIVRYFHTWVESPPPGWQEIEDKHLFSRINSTSIDIDFTEDSSSILHHRKSTSTSTNKHISDNLRAPVKKQLSVIEDESSSIQFKDSKGLSGGDQLWSNDDSLCVAKNHYSESIDDSFIVFQNSDNSKSITSYNNKSVTTSIPKRKKRVSSLSENEIKPVEVGPIMEKMYLYIQMQLCRKQSLKEWLQENTLEARKGEIIPIFKQIVDGVEYVHMKGLIHRDLKPSNIFFALDGEIKIGDFGLVTDMPDYGALDCKKTLNGVNRCDKYTLNIGTQLYMAPEQLNGHKYGYKYNYKVDIYSLGLILFELLVAFSTEMERITIMKKLRQLIFPDSFSNTYIHEFELLNQMLSDNPDERPSTYGIRAYPPLNENGIETKWYFDLPNN